MRRREFIALLSGAGLVWPLAARAQQSGGMRRIGVLMSTAEDDPEGQARIMAFLDGLQQLGWTDGRTVQIVTHWGAGNAEQIRKYAAEPVALAPDVILASGELVTEPLLRVTHTVPVVFTQVPDPVGAGYVQSLARPGGNATGFTLSEYGMAGKWLQVLKEIAPGVTRAAVVCDPSIQQAIGLWGAIQTAAPSFGIEVSPVNVREAGELEHALAALALSSNGSLIVTGSGFAIVHRQLIIALAARHRLPAVYPLRLFVTSGGLISYGADFD